MKATTRLEGIAAPALLGVALLLHAYSETPIHWVHLGRPLIAVVLGTIFVALIVRLVIRESHVATSMVIAIVLLFFGQSLIGTFVLSIAGGIWWYERDHQFDVPTGALILPVAIFTGLTLWKLHDWHVVAPEDFLSPSAAAVEPVQGQDRPNIHLLLLDGYPRQDTLAALGHDNEPFLAELASLGFAIDRESSSPYVATDLALAAMALEDPFELEPYIPTSNFATWIEQRRSARRHYLVSHPVMDDLRALGYHLTYVPSPVLHVDWAGWDERQDTGHLTDFEIHLLQLSPLRYVLGDWAMDQLRDRVDASLTAWSTRPHDPAVTFAHVMAPHTPFLWDGDGEAAPLECWYAVECNMFHTTVDDLRLAVSQYAGLVGHNIQAVNDRVLGAVRQLVSKDPDAIVVVFSDHGLRYETPRGDEWHRNLFAARGIHASSPVGLLHVLFDEVSRVIRTQP